MLLTQSIPNDTTLVFVQVLQYTLKDWCFVLIHHSNVSLVLQNASSSRKSVGFNIIGTQILGTTGNLHCQSVLKCFSWPSSRSQTSLMLRRPGTVLMADSGWSLFEKNDTLWVYQFNPK